MNTAKRAIASIALVVGIGAAPTVGASNCPSVVGTYGAVSESEWDIQVLLKDRGRAEVVHVSWLAGEHDERETTRTPATWRFTSECEIELSYLGFIDRFEFTENLPLAELGFTGGAPGIRHRRPFAPGSKIKGVSLWKKPHKFGVSR